MEETMYRFILISGALIFLALAGCSDENKTPSGPTGKQTLNLSFQGITPLNNGLHYEGWAIINNAPVSTGKFNVDANGTLIDLNGNPVANGDFNTGTDLSSASAIVLTIEPSGDQDPAPAATHFLGGDVSDNTATLTVGHSTALGNDFSTAMGEYILATPTNGADTDENSGIWFLNPPTTTFQMNFSGIEPLANGYHYEGWAIVNGQAITTGKFNVDGNGNLVDLSGNIIANNNFTVGGDLSSATAIVLTIEPNGDSDPAPAATHFIGGDVMNNAATLTVGHSSSLGNDFSSSAGNYILATPTNGANTDENSGIWFLDLSSGMPEVGLQLPVLPSGWEYEGWVVMNGIPVTSGKFTDPAMADFAAPYSSTQPGPPFPGEDYLLNAPAGLTFPTNIAGGTAVISIEPMPDDDPAPFTLKPLVGAIPANATDHVTYAMDNNAAGFPTGSVTITVNAPTQGLQLAALPAGWEYEGWVVINGMPVTTGKFSDPAMADFAAPFSSTQPAPPFPGEDFLLNAPTGLNFPTNIAGGTAVISIEPMPDDDSVPFILKPLVGMIPANAVDHFIYQMDNNSGTFPEGVASIK